MNKTKIISIIGILLLTIFVCGCVENSVPTNENHIVKIVDTPNPIKILNPNQHQLGEKHIFKNITTNIEYTFEVSKIMYSTEYYKIQNGFSEHITTKNENLFIWIYAKSTNTGNTITFLPEKYDTYIIINETKYEFLLSLNNNPMQYLDSCDPCYIRGETILEENVYPAYTQVISAPGMGIEGWIGFEVPYTNNFKIYVMQTNSMSKQIMLQNNNYPTIFDQYAFWEIKDDNL